MSSTRKIVVAASKPAPKHRAQRSRRTLPTPSLRAVGRPAAVAGGVAVTATALAVSSGVLINQDTLPSGAAALSASTDDVKTLSDKELAEREQQASRSIDDRRPAAVQTKRTQLSNASGVTVTRSEDISKSDPKSIAKALMPQYGLDPGQFGCLESLWNRESGWNPRADNPSSSAYGIPQALPGSKMSSAGADWATNPETQIRWGLGYIRDRYGSACGAWGHSESNNWY